MSSQQPTPHTLPRISITFCTQCRWMLRAAYFAQELLSTFSTQIGEVALIPATGGLFQVELTYVPESSETASEGAESVLVGEIEARKALLWDRKEKGGFPETKVLKQLVRDHIDPSKDLGHSDRHGKKKLEESESAAQKIVEAQQETGDSAGLARKETKKNADGTVCEDCV